MGAFGVTGVEQAEAFEDNSAFGAEVKKAKEWRERQLKANDGIAWQDRVPKISPATHLFLLFVRSAKTRLGRTLEEVDAFWANPPVLKHFPLVTAADRAVVMDEIIGGLGLPLVAFESDYVRLRDLGKLALELRAEQHKEEAQETDELFLDAEQVQERREVRLWLLHQAEKSKPDEPEELGQEDSLRYV